MSPLDPPFRRRDGFVVGQSVARDGAGQQHDTAAARARLGHDLGSAADDVEGRVEVGLDNIVPLGVGGGVRALEYEIADAVDHARDGAVVRGELFEGRVDLGTLQGVQGEGGEGLDTRRQGVHFRRVAAYDDDPVPLGGQGVGEGAPDTPSGAENDVQRGVGGRRRRRRSRDLTGLKRNCRGERAPAE